MRRGRASGTAAARGRGVVRLLVAIAPAVVLAGIAVVTPRPAAAEWSDDVVAGIDVEAASLHGAWTSSVLAAGLSRPYWLALAPDDSYLLVTTLGAGANRVYRVTAAGAVSVLAGSGAQTHADGVGTAASLAYPAWLGWGRNGVACVVEDDGGRVSEVTTAGAVTAVTGTSMATTNCPVGQSALGGMPHAFVIAPDGRFAVVIGETAATRNGVVYDGHWVAGDGRGFADGAAAVARFNNPEGIALDPAGDGFWVADTGNRVIRRVGADGTVMTIAGAPAVIGCTDGIAAAARFSIPEGLEFGPDGALYIADELCGVRRLDPATLEVTTPLPSEDGLSSIGISAAAADGSFALYATAYSRDRIDRFLWTAPHW